MPIKQKSSTLFVCTANQCRSPMAEALFKQYLDTSGYSEEIWKIGSAGCWAYPGMDATKKAILAVSGMGAETIRLHESQPVTEQLLELFHLILCMETSHVDFIKKHFPKMKNRVFLFSEMVDKKFDIDDPVGQSQEEYQETANQLHSILKNGFEKIKVLSSETS